MSYPQEAFLATVLLPGTLIQQRREAVAINTLLYQLKVLKETGRYDCFKLHWHPVYNEKPEVWPVPNHLFWDSDVAKWIEGACYVLHDHRNLAPEVEPAINELVDMICSAQQPDGYINLHYTIVEPGKRFTNLRDMHELYNAGHLIEAALAHHNYYQTDALLTPIRRYADLLVTTFGPGPHQMHGYPGHPEIELALLRLYVRTREQGYLDLARYFILERGSSTSADGLHYFDLEARNRNDDPRIRPAYHTEPGGCRWYYQAHKPLIEQATVEGHAVRAMYLLTAAADLVRLERRPDSDLLRCAVLRLWNNMVERKMYVTGGIGAVKQYEGFGQDYFLPLGTDEGGCYAETCASIGVMLLAQRILQFDLDRRYADVIELCLYNAVLTSMSTDGRQFTYVNQLASSDADPALRARWFTVACCPPNVLRLLGSVSGYVCDEHRSDEDEVELRIHQYISSTHKFQVAGRSCTLHLESDWPWDGLVQCQVDAPTTANLSLKLRLPSWARTYELSPQPANIQIDRGYINLPATWVRENPSFIFKVDMQPRFLTSHPLVRADTVTVARGPLIYCAEDIDNPWVTDHFAGTQVRVDAVIHERRLSHEKCGDTSVVMLTIDNGASRLDTTCPAALPSFSVEESDMRSAHATPIPELHLVPFFHRANRGGNGSSRVSFRRWHVLTAATQCKSMLTTALE